MAVVTQFEFDETKIRTYDDEILKNDKVVESKKKEVSKLFTNTYQNSLIRAK